MHIQYMFRIKLVPIKFYFALLGVFRYKVTCESTWPTYSGSAKKATELIARRHKVFEDVAFGNSKVFIRTPRTLTLLEQERAARIPQVVIIIQRVCPSR